MLSLKSERFEIFSGKVPEIERDDHVGATDYRGGKNMAIVFVRERLANYEGAITSNDCIWHREIHVLASSLHLFRRYVLVHLSDGPHPFFMNILAPLDTKKARRSEPDSDVRKPDGCEYVCIEECRVARHLRLLPAQLLGFLCHLVGKLLARRMHGLAVFHKFAEFDTAMSADHAE